MIDRTQLQMAGMRSLTVLAALLLVLIAYMTTIAIGHVTPDGKVPVVDASLLTGLLLAFQTVVSAIRSTWESQERTAMADKLADSAPSAQTAPPPADAVDAARQTADAAKTKADEIQGDS